MLSDDLQPSVTTQEAELLEWIRGAHAERFTMIIERHGDGGSRWNVKTADLASDTVSSGTGASFDEAWAWQSQWAAPEPELVPDAFSVITGGRDV